jgi:hypothetical protein
VESLIPPVSPAIVLSVLVGAFHTCLYVVIRGTLRRHVLVVLGAAIGGALVGQAVGRRAGDPLQLGDYSLLWASVMAWVGILVVVLVAAIRPERRREAEPLPDGRSEAPGRTPDTAEHTGTEGRTPTR